ncbi:MAG: O-antigen ligase family protein [Bacteroidia bacterium]
MNREKVSENIYLFGLLLLVAAMPLSVFMMSVSQIILAVSWLISGNIIDKTKTAFRNPVVAVLTTIYFMHLVGGFYSTDFNYYFNDIRVKIPLLVLPVIIYSSPKISEQWFNRIIAVFVFAVLASTLISMGVLYDILPHKNPIYEARNISIFISHIRLSLFICIAVFATVFYLIKNQHTNSFIKDVFLILLISWFIIFLFILEAMTGFIILVFIAILLFLNFVLGKKGTSFKIAAITLILSIPFFTFIYIRNEAARIFPEHRIDISALDKKTPNGNLYHHSLDAPLPELPYLNPRMQENGTPLVLYVCAEEMERAWNNRSSLNYNGKDLRGQELKYTLARFLSSKGFRKDSTAVYNLSESEINAIENGIPNVEYQNKISFKNRVDKIIMEYYSHKYGENPSGKSILQRIEFWKAGWNIFTANFIVGVGTGDVRKAFDAEYQRMNSMLAESSRLRAHNQYLTFALTFGIFGLLFFLFSLLYPIIKLKKMNDYFYMIFILIAALSMLTEDTLETQAGVTFFAFFNSFLLFALKNSPDDR